MTPEIKVDSGASPWDAAKLFINNELVEHGSKITLFRDVENDVTVEVPPSIARTISLLVPESDDLQFAAKPPFEEWVAPLDDKFNWKLKPNDDKSGHFTMVFFSRETVVPWVHSSRVLSSRLEDEMEVRIEGAEVPPGGNVFLRGIRQKVTLSPKPGSPLCDNQVTLTCEVAGALYPEDVTSSPPFDVAQSHHEWFVTGRNRSGIIRLSLKDETLPDSLKVAPIKLLSTRLADEVDVKMGGHDIPGGGKVFLRSKPERISLVPKTGSPIAGHPIKLMREAFPPLVQGDLSSSPSFDVPQSTHQWDITGKNRSGTFRLRLEGDRMSGSLLLPTSTLLSPNLDDELLVEFNNKPLVSPAYPARGGTYDIRLKPKNSSPLVGRDLRLALNVYPAELDLNLRPFVAQPLQAGGTNWTLACGNIKNGDFKVVASADGLPLGTLEMPMKLAHNELALMLEPFPPTLAYGSNSQFAAVVSSARLPDEKIAGADVSFTFNNSTQSKKTGAGGRVEFIPDTRHVGRVSLQAQTLGGNGVPATVTGTVQITEPRWDEVFMYAGYGTNAPQLIHNWGSFKYTPNSEMYFYVTHVDPVFYKNFQLNLSSPNQIKPVIGNPICLTTITYWTIKIPEHTVGEAKMTLTAQNVGASIGMFLAQRS